MDTTQLQREMLYSLPSGARMKVVDTSPNHEHYVIHTRLSYYRLEEKLLQVNAPQLSYRLFYLFASELEHPYGNALSYSVKKLCSHFRLSDASIYIVLSKLFMADVARKLKKHVLILDPYIAFAGDKKHRDLARRQWDGETLGPDDPMYILDGKYEEES